MTNGIKAKADKTKVMVFGSKNLPEFDVKIEGLSKVSSYKYLGVTLDDQLNYNLHVNKIISSVTAKGTRQNSPQPAAAGCYWLS